MSREQILRVLQAKYPEMVEKFDVTSLSIFGSAGRDELREESDVDILVEFRGPTSFDGYFDLKFYLERLLDRPVDLATQNIDPPGNS